MYIYMYIVNSVVCTNDEENFNIKFDSCTCYYTHLKYMHVDASNIEINIYRVQP